MKKALFFALAIAIAFSTVKAQYYSSMGSLQGGRINIFAGLNNDLNGNTTFLGSKAHTDSWGGVWYDWGEVLPTTLSHDMGFCLGLDFSILNEKSDNFMIGATAGIFGTKGKMHASFDKAALGRPYDTDIDIEYNEIDFHIGIAGLIYVVPEKVSIDFSVSPGFLFSFGDQVRYNRTPAILGDTDNNTWGEAKPTSDMAMPNIDIMVLGRIGVSYHFTEIMWVGALFQYRYPILAFGGEAFAEDAIRSINGDLRYSNRKHTGYALMLTWGIDLE